MMSVYHESTVGEKMDWLNDALDKQYTLVTALKQTPSSQVLLLRHKTLHWPIVKRTFTGSAEVYRHLLNVTHPHLPRIYEVVQRENIVTVLEEYIDGCTVAQVLETGHYTERGTRQVSKQLCDALSALHSLGIVHRDIKPENVMVDCNGMTKLIDFNACRLVKPAQSKDTQLLGTAGYAAPEQYGFKESDERTDIYALGMLMNVMLTGEHYSKQRARGRLGKIIRRCVQPSPEERFSDALSLRRAL